MTPWPVEHDGDEYQPVPRSWLDHPDAYHRQHRTGPRLLAVSVALRNHRTLRVRYVHPRSDEVLVCQTAAVERNNGHCPEALVNGTGWPHSLHPGPSEPTDVRRECETEHLQDLWGDRLDQASHEDGSKELIADGGTRVPQNPMHPKRTGSSVESVVIDGEEGLSTVGDREAAWHDAVTTTALTPTDERPFGSICVVETDTPVEIKGCLPEVQNGDGTVSGRWYIKREAHEQLTESSGVYWFTVYAPRPETPILAQIVVPAAVVNDLLAGSWYDNGRREVAKLTWTTILRESEVSNRAE